MISFVIFKRRHAQYKKSDGKSWFFTTEDAKYKICCNCSKKMWEQINLSENYSVALRVSSDGMTEVLLRIPIDST